MEFGLFNITTATTTTLIAKGQKAGAVTSIRLVNIHDTDPVKLDLFLDDDTNKTYFFKNNIINAGERIILDKGINFDDSILSLKITTAKPVSVSAVNVNVITK